MTREQVLDSDGLKHKFANYYNVPISNFQNPYFYDNLETLDVWYGSVRKFGDFCDDLKTFDSAEDYRRAVYSVTNAVIDHLLNNESIQQFANQYLDSRPVSDFRYRTVSPITDNNDQFISIRLKDATFCPLSHYSNSLFDGAKTYKEFISKYTNLHCLTETSIGYVMIFPLWIFNSLNHYNIILLNALCHHILKELPCAEIYGIYDDEILLKIPQNGFNFSLDQFNSVVEDFSEFLFDISVFCLHNVQNTDGYLRVYHIPEDKIEPVDIDCSYLPAVIKRYYDKPVLDSDLIFEYHGKLMKFINDPTA